MTMTLAISNENNERTNPLCQLQTFGIFQKIQYFLILLPIVLVAMSNVNYIFVAEDVNYRCRVPECENGNFTVQTPSWWPENVDSKCMRPVVDTSKYDFENNTCSNEIFYETLEQCNEWIYENNNSIVADLNLACQPWKATLVGSIHNAGMIVSMMFTGWFADKIGRKPTTIICSVCGCIGMIKIFITNYYGYLAIEFLESLLASGLYTVAVVLLIEVGGETKRVFTGVIFAYAIYVGEVVYAFVAMGFVYWKSIILAIYIPMTLFLSYTFILRESTRWQMLRGKMDEAKATLKLVAKFNKLNITAVEIENADPNDIRATFNVEEQKEKESMKVILSSKEIMKRFAVTAFCFFTSSFLYYGALVYSVLLPGDKYTNFILVAIASFPGDLLAYFAFEKFGRKLTLQYGYLFSATFLIAQNYCPNSLTWLKLFLFLMGKFGVVICFTGIYTYSLELFPTSVRGSLLGWGNTAARVGSMLAPLTPLLITEWESLPSVLFSTTALLAAALLTFVPETKSLPMFDTIAQIEAYMSKNMPT